MTCRRCAHSFPARENGWAGRGFLRCKEINRNGTLETRAMYLNPRHTCAFEPSRFEGKKDARQ